MYISAILNSINILICYFLLIVALPSLILASLVKGETIFKRFTIYLIFGNLYISSIIFILAYLTILNKVSLILSIVFLSIFIWWIINKNQIKKNSLAIKDVFNKFIMGSYGVKLFLWRYVKNLIGRIRRFAYELFNNKKIEWAIFLLIIAYNVYQYGINNIEFFTYMAPDEEVHLYWIQSLIAGKIFPSGVYPHIFHNILGAITEVFGLSAMMVLKGFASTSCILIMTMLYFGLRKIFDTKYPALFGLMMYSILNIYGNQVTYRFQFAIPQEYAMIMLMPMAIFLIDYINDKKILDLIFFGISLSLMLGIHFYTAIIGIVLIISIGIVYLYKIIKDKIFLKLLLCGVLSVVVAIAPLGIGLALGHKMEQSMDWATDVIKGDIYDKAEEEPTLTWQQFIKDSKEGITKYAILDIRVFNILLGIIILTIIINSRNRYRLIFAINSLILIFLILMRYMKLPTIMEGKRVAIYFAYFSPIWLGMYLEILMKVLARIGLKKIVPFISTGIIALGLVMAIKFDYIRPIPPFYYFQPTGTMVTNKGIMENYEDYTWTAVSPVNNISAVSNNGYHYELSDFIIGQEDWNKKMKIQIPTEYVFIYIEKKPIINYGYRFYKDELDIANRKTVNKKDALMKFTNMEDNFYYEEERHILMAKAYYWAEEYKKYFPNEMNVYYEDDELVVYRIKQNPYALHNFSIDYGINSR